MAERAHPFRGLLGRLREQWRSVPDPPPGASQDVSWQALLDQARLIAVVLDERAAVTYANRHLVSLVGGADDVVGRDWFEAFVPDGDRNEAREAFRRVMETGAAESHGQSDIVTRGGERRRVAWDHTVLRDGGGRPAGVASIGTDITERIRTEELLRQGVLYDALTGLPNRSLFIDRLAGCIARAKRRPKYRFAVLLLDVDRFKVVNDSLGHVVGDTLLVEVGRRIEKCLRPGDSVARLGGDEFAVLVEDMADSQVPALVAGRIQSALGRPFELDGREVFLTASVGTAEHKPRYELAEDLMRDADSAMHHAKAKGKGRHEMFATAMHARALVLLQIENDLHRAMEREELSLHYQPIVSTDGGRVAGFEALIRWQRPEGGTVPSADFIRIAEETGLIVPMGAWVLREACRQLRLWQDRIGSADRSPTMSVNLSARQFAQPDLVAQIARTVQEAGVHPANLKLEVTESVLMQEPEAAAGMLAELGAQGVKTCIDDFGTGYSSLSYLMRLPAHTIKIDRSFVGPISGQFATFRQHIELIRTIVALAHNLGMDVVAEGVETEDQLERLRAIQCDFVQGFLLSPAVDAAAAERLLDGGPLRPSAAPGS